MVRKMVEEMNTLKGYVRAMLTGRAPFDPPGVTFPKSHMIHAGSIRQAHEMIKDGGYFVVSKDDIQLFKASTSQAEVNFQFATEGKTAVFSELGRAKEGSKTFFARDYWKLRISLGEDGRTTDWILMKDAKQCRDVATPGDIVVNKKALDGDMRTSSTPDKNDNYEKEKPCEDWRKEKKRMRKALKNSPAYIRGRLETPPKKRNPTDPDDLVEEGKVQKVTETAKVEKVTTDKAKVEEAERALRGGRKTKKKYFDFVKRVLEQKSKKKAEKKTQEEEKVFAAFAPKV